jgi:hypothetical protein
MNFAGARQYMSSALIFILFVYICITSLDRFPGVSAKKNSIAARQEQKTAEICAMVDRVFTTPEISSGNLFLQFSGFDTAQPDQANYISLVYYRAVYTRYPQRIFIADTETIINNGRDIGTINFTPETRWLNDHAIHALVTFSRSKNGSVQVSVKNAADRKSIN